VWAGGRRERGGGSRKERWGEAEGGEVMRCWGGEGGEGGVGWGGREEMPSFSPTPSRGGGVGGEIVDAGP